MRLILPIKLKVFFPALLGVAGCVLLFRDLALRGLNDDRTAFGLEVAQTVADVLREDTETLVKFRLQELEKLAGEAQRGHENRLFLRASSDFRSDVVAVEFFDPKGDGKFETRSAINADLLKARDLPVNLLALMNGAAPIDVARLDRDRDSTLINRSVLVDGKPVPVLSHVLFVRHLDGRLNGTIIVLDVLADSLLAKMRRSTTAETFLVNRAGELIAHSDPTLLVQYRNQAFPDFPLNLLTEDWSQGTTFSWNQDGREWIHLVLPLGMPGVLLSARVEKRQFTEVLAKLEEQFWLGAWAILGVLVVLTGLVAWGLKRNIRNTAATIQCLAQGDFDRMPKLSTRDEFLDVRDAFSVFGPRLRNRLAEEFARGQKDAQLATIQTLRAAMGNPVPSRFEGWEFIAHRPSDLTPLQDFWDFHQQGGRRQIIVGRANTAGIPGLMMSVMIRTTMDNLRRLSGKFSTQRPPSLAELLEMLNAHIHAAFKGRICLQGTALEMDIDTGAFSWINMASPTPLRWVPTVEKKPVVIDDKTLSEQNPALGQQAIAGFRAINGFFAPGERFFISMDTILPKGAKEDASRKMMQKLIVSEGRKSLADLKAAIADYAAPPLLKQNLCFIGLRRPGGVAVETASVPSPAPVPASAPTPAPKSTPKAA